MSHRVSTVRRMANLVPSLELLSQRVISERRELRAHADALDSKTGLALGISGVLAAVPDAATVVATVGRCLAAAAALLCVAALFPRPFTALELRELRDQYLTQPDQLTRLDILDTDVAMHARDSAQVRRKVRLLKAAFTALLLAISTFAAGIIFG